MDVGVVLQTTPPSARVVDLAKRAEAYGFSHVWTFDSHILWQEPYVIYSQILAETRNVIVGPMVTNPATRDWTVTASVYATLNEMYGNRTVCGIGRGRLGGAGHQRQADHDRHAARVDPRHPRAGQRPRRRLQGLDAPLPVGDRSPSSRCGSPATGRRRLALAGEVGDGFILQLADPQITAWTIAAVRDAAERAGRDPDDVTICVAAPAYVGDDTPRRGPHARPVPLVRRHGRQPRRRHRRPLRRRSSERARGADRLHRGRKGYDYNQHGQAGNTHADFVPDEIVDRFCLLGPVDEQLRRLGELRDLGVDQFAVYLQHDAKDATLQAYGEQVLPALADHVAAKA